MTRTRDPGQTKFSEQNILNNSYDTDFGVLAVELLSFDPLSNALKRVTTKAMGDYETNDTTDTDASPYYVGKENADGQWFITRVDTTSGNQIRYASVTNNPLITSYSSAWASYSTLTYGTYSEAF